MNHVYYNILVLNYLFDLLIFRYSATKMEQPKNIVITGGNRGIGYELVKYFYLQGHNVIFGSRNEQKNSEVVKEIT